MFCSKCHNTVVDTASFCPFCGNPLATPASPVTHTPQGASPSIDVANYDPSSPRPASVYNYGTSAKTRGLSKNQYLKTEAPDNIKKLAKSSYWIFAVSAFLSIICLFSALTTPFYDLKICQVVDENMCDSARYSLEREREDFEENLEYVPPSQRSALRDFYDNPSLQNASDYIEACGISSSSPVARLITIGEIALWVVTIMIIGFAFLAAYLKSTVSSVFTAVFSAIFGIMFSPAIFTLLSVASAIVLAVVCSKINTAYKS